jgi:thioesterase domain-containing protein
MTSGSSPLKSNLHFVRYCIIHSQPKELSSQERSRKMASNNYNDTSNSTEDDERVDSNSNSVYDLFHDIIPATTLGITVEMYDRDECVLIVSAPLRLNQNDKGTAFAGSIYSTLVLSGWALVTQLLRDIGDLNNNIQVVVASSSTQYIAPVTSSRFQSCARIKQTQLNDANIDSPIDQLIQSVRTRGKGKIEVVCELLSGDDGSDGDKKCCAKFTALYAASLRPTSSVSATTTIASSSL